MADSPIKWRVQWGLPLGLKTSEKMGTSMSYLPFIPFLTLRLPQVSNDRSIAQSAMQLAPEA